MKNKIKKILLLGMTAMFTAGAAGTAVISCPVWADEAEQNSETAEEPKAERMAKKYFRSNRNRQIIRWISTTGKLPIRMMRLQQ